MLERRGHISVEQFAFLRIGEHDKLRSPRGIDCCAGLCGETMGSIAAEQFVSAISGQGHLDVLCDQLRQEIARHDAGERLVEAPQDLADAIRKAGERDLLFVMIGAVALGNPARPSAVLLLAGRGGILAVGEREGLDRTAGGFRRNGGRQARVEAAAEKETNRHVRHQPALDTLLQQASHFGGRGFV